ncbi:D-glycero-beta-D-manno-heptose 1-phosphate adenylyltransferase [Sporocytophaga myxococcoides]|uniref:D-glycero-beta-D-manno-heptose 1-phosphate adenylyltransferase n=1 Tax=Sporocytophaga myxococcoides TaxID=153721 RepID=UPI00041FEF13|nr:D-glycero-beta-D-manno-heptose 1-phosphate adenylyltransferase [Sporocytophaga myxococcoides]
MNNQYYNLIGNFEGKKILIVGDAILDTYIKGYSERLSREAPVPIINVEEQIHECGGAANTAINCSALGAEVIFITVLGKDNDGKELIDVLKSNKINTDYIIQEKNRSTLSKRRVTASSSILLRIDEGNTDSISSETESVLYDRIKKIYHSVDAVILSDYGYGILTESVIKHLRKLKSEKEKIFVIDSKDLKKFKSIQPKAVKPNYEETVTLLNLSKITNNARIKQVSVKGEKLLEVTGAEVVISTMDADGSFLFEKGKEPFWIKAIPGDNRNAIGAGDTFISAFALSLCCKNDAKAALEIASAAASIVVQKEGTCSCSAEELKGYFSGNPKYFNSLLSLVGKIEKFRVSGKKIVFTNGCFDILHKGHIDLLNQAKSFGDILIVGLNSDISIKRLKGEDRPINSLEDRISVLSGLATIDFIISFEEDSPSKIIQAIKPDFFVKGGDYKTKIIPEASIVNEFGGEVRVVGFIEDKSTTNIINKIKDSSPSSKAV